MARGLEQRKPGANPRSLRGGCRFPEPQRARRIGDGIVRGKKEIAALYRRAIERFPKLNFELEDVIERPQGVIVIYRKLGVFADNPGLTVEVFEFEKHLVKRNTLERGGGREPVSGLILIGRCDVQVLC